MSLPKALPARPSLEHLKNQAKDLLKAYRRGERDAYARIREHLPSAHGKEDAALAAMKLALHDAQSVVAREYGCASWKELCDAATPGSEPVSLQNIRALMGPIPDVVASAIATAGARVVPFTGELPASLPLVATRNVLLTVGAIAPLDIGRPSSIRAVEEAQRNEKLLAMFAQKDAATDSPGAEDLHPVGCAVQIVTIAPARTNALWLVVKAIRWVRLDGVDRGDASSVARVSELRIRTEANEETERLHRELRARVDVLVASLPDADEMRRLTAKMSALELADATVANLPWAVEEKARYASELDLERRLRLVLGLMNPEE